MSQNQEVYERHDDACDDTDGQIIAELGGWDFHCDLVICELIPHSPERMIEPADGLKRCVTLTKVVHADCGITAAVADLENLDLFGRNLFERFFFVRHVGYLTKTRFT